MLVGPVSYIAIASYTIFSFQRSIKVSQCGLLRRNQGQEHSGNRCLGTYIDKHNISEF